MDYETGDTIDLDISPNGLIFRYICKYPLLPLPELKGNEHYNEKLSICPACGSDDTAVYTSIGHYCKTCCIVWSAELGASCIECGRPLQPLGTDILICSWCGQRWETEVIRESYSLGDHASQIDWSTPKGANR